MKFWIHHIGGCYFHKDCLEIIPAGNKEWRFCFMWIPTVVPFAWFYISKKWNVSWNVEKKLRFSIFNWENIRKDD